MTPGASKVAVARSERIREQENNEGTGCSSRHREQPGHTQRGWSTAGFLLGTRIKNTICACVLNKKRVDFIITSSSAAQEKES